MSREGLCSHGDGGKHELWEEDTSCRKCHGHSLWVKDCEVCGGTGLNKQPEKSDA
jgi:hypothetical protein